MPIIRRKEVLSMASFVHEKYGWDEKASFLKSILCCENIRISWQNTPLSMLVLDHTASEMFLPAGTGLFHQQKWLIAQELGHYFLSRNGLTRQKAFFKLPDRQNMSSEQYRNRVEAVQFGQELLLPEKQFGLAMEECDDMSRLESRYCISAGAVTSRILVMRKFAHKAEAEDESELSPQM